jgi:uncharacterized membrane protein
MEYITRSSIALVTIATVLTMFLTLYGGGQATLAQQNTSENNSSEKAGMNNMTNILNYLVVFILYDACL